MNKSSGNALTGLGLGHEQILDAAAFIGLRQTYLIAPNGSGQLQTTIAERTETGGSGDAFQFADLPTRGADPSIFDPESVYLLAWQTPSVTATLTAICDGAVVGSMTVMVGNDPLRVRVDWDAIDQLAVSHTGTPGFPVTDNFLFL